MLCRVPSWIDRILSQALLSSEAALDAVMESLLAGEDAAALAETYRLLACLARSTPPPPPAAAQAAASTWRAAALSPPALQRASWVLQHAQHEPLLLRCLEALLFLLRSEALAGGGRRPLDLAASGLPEAAVGLVRAYCTRHRALDWDEPPEQPQQHALLSDLRLTATHCDLALRLIEALAIFLGDAGGSTAALVAVLIAPCVDVFDLAMADSIHPDLTLAASAAGTLGTLLELLEDLPLQLPEAQQAARERIKSWEARSGRP